MERRAAGPDTGRGARQAFLAEMAAVDAQIALRAASVDFGAALEAAGQPVVADDDGR